MADQPNVPRDASSTDTSASEPQSIEQIVDTVGLHQTRRHIFLCCDQTKPKCCDRQRSIEAWEYLKRRLKELGLSEKGGVFRTKTVPAALTDVRVGLNPVADDPWARRLARWQPRYGFLVEAVGR